MSDDTPKIISFSYVLPDPLARLPALAERLGVKECNSSVSVKLQTKDGRTYDLFDLIDAVLDRLDKVTRWRNSISPGFTSTALSRRR